VVFPTLRSASSIWAVRRPVLTTSPPVCIWSPTSMSSYRPRPSRLPVFAPTSTLSPASSLLLFTRFLD
jgi:hypothetical protein